MLAKQGSGEINNPHDILLTHISVQGHYGLFNHLDDLCVMCLSHITPERKHLVHVPYKY